MEIHVVQRGDTLWQIAQTYGTDMNQIVLLNELDNPDVLIVGQSIVVPDPGREYVIAPGDTLWQIAQRFGISVQELAAANQMTDPSLIYVGQMLINPYLTHIVQPGEYIWAIAQMYGVSAEQLIAVNGMEQPGLIFPGQILRIPAAARPTTEVNAYITQLNEAGSSEMKRRGRYLTYISPFRYSIAEDGTLSELSDESVLQAGRAHNVAPLLVVTNLSQGEFDSDLAAALLHDSDVQEQLISNIMTSMRTKGYAGVNFNLEYVYPEDRENYNQFLRYAAQRLHSEGFLLTTTLAPKYSADQQGVQYEAHDYKAHGEIADIVILMTYEWGWSGGRPRAIAPLDEVKSVLDYAVTVISPDKILMGMPLYGRNWEIPWVEGTTASTVSPRKAVQLASEYGAAIQYDEAAQSPFFRYTDESGQGHEVWFEDARSVQAKYDTVKDYDLRGVSYWFLGSLFPQNWPVLQNNFTIRKL